MDYEKKLIKATENYGQGVKDAVLSAYSWLKILGDSEKVAYTKAMGVFNELKESADRLSADRGGSRFSKA